MSPQASGPHGVLAPRQHVDGILDRIEAALTEFAHLNPPLDQRERLERAIQTAHRDDIAALQRRLRE